MRIIKRQGKSEFEVVTGFMKEFNLKRNQFTYEIIDKGSNGFFNLFGAKPVVINFMLQQDDDGVKMFIEGILKHMDVDFHKVTSQKKNGTISVDLIGVKEKGFVIGKDGRLLNSIQHLVNRMLLNKGIDNVQVVVDCEGYRQNHETQILTKARDIAQKVKQRKKSYTFDPMRSTDRKVIHRFIEKDKSLRTMTVGKGEMKRVVVMLDSDDKSKPAKDQAKNPDNKPERNEGRQNAKPRRRRRPRRPNRSNQE